MRQYNVFARITNTLYAIFTFYFRVGGQYVLKLTVRFPMTYLIPAWTTVDSRHSNLLGKSKKVRVSGSSKLITGDKKMGWGMNASNMHTSKLD